MAGGGQVYFETPAIPASLLSVIAPCDADSATVPFRTRIIWGDSWRTPVRSAIALDIARSLITGTRYTGND